jgi:hypothetical protein
VRAGKKRKGRRKRRKREEGRRGVRWGEGEKQGENKRKRKRKREKEWDTCHHVGGREKMRLSFPSQFGSDMWQGEISFFI